MTSAPSPQSLRQSPIAEKVSQIPDHVVRTHCDNTDAITLFDCSCFRRASITGTPQQLNPYAPVFGRSDRSEDGDLVVRISNRELLILPHSKEKLVEPAGLSQTPGYEHGYWFYLVGNRMSEVLTEACQVDLRPSTFEPFMALRTRIFSTSSTLIREDYRDQLGYHILGCQTFAAHVFEALFEASQRTGTFFVTSTDALPLNVSKPSESSPQHSLSLSV